MGDDQGDHVSSGGRAPWERGPTPDPAQADTPDSSSATPRMPRSARHADPDDTTDSGMISVRDLMERFERDGKKPSRRAKADTGGLPLPSDRAAHSGGGSAAHAVPEGAEQQTVVIPRVVEPDIPIASRQAEAGPTVPTKREKSPAESRPSRNSRLRTVGRVGCALSAVAVLVATGAGWNYLRKTDKGFTQVAALDRNSTDIVDPVGQTGDENYLIVGLDSRSGANAQVGAGTTADAEGARSDTIMLVNIPADRKRVVAVSFPRDLDIKRPDCQRWNNDTATYTDETYPGADNDKLNGAYALGGPKCLVKVIQKMSGLNIGHFVGIDFAGFEAMVNQVGGVEVCNRIPLVDGELGTVLRKTGRQMISGKTALNYVRARHVSAETSSDYDRIKRQQRFLSSLLRAALSNKVLLDPSKLNGFIGAFTQHTFVQNVTTQDLLLLGRSLQKMDANAVTFLTVPTGGTTEWGNEIPRMEDIKALFTAIIDNEPLPGERRAPALSPAAPTTVPPAAPSASKQRTAVEASSTTLKVLNGTGKDGAAATAARKLERYGFTVDGYDSFSEGTLATTTVRYSPGHENDAATVASSLPGAQLQESTGLGGTVQVVLGANYYGTVKTPIAAGKPITQAFVMAPKTSVTPTTPALPTDLEHFNAADNSCV